MSFLQINMSLQIHNLEVVEIILSKIKNISLNFHEFFQKIFHVIKSALQNQENHIVKQNFKIIKLQSEIINLNAYIVQNLQTSIMSRNKKRKKDLINNSEIFKNDDKKLKKN